MYKNRPQNIDELQERTRLEIAQIIPEVLHKVQDDLIVSLLRVINLNTCELQDFFSINSHHTVLQKQCKNRQAFIIMYNNLKRSISKAEYIKNVSKAFKHSKLRRNSIQRLHVGRQNIPPHIGFLVT